MNFFINWLVCYVGILIAMSTDNFWWVSSSPEFHKVRKYSWKNYFNYLWKDRFIPVMTDYRDLIPAIYTSFGLALILSGLFYWGIFVLILSILITAIVTKFLNSRNWN